MVRPNLNPAPQPKDGIVLRGAIQMETALLALQAADLNPSLQVFLGTSLEETVSRAEDAEDAGVPLNETWFMLHSKEARKAKRDILGALALAEAKATGNQELAMAAGSLRSILTAK